MPTKNMWRITQIHVHVPCTVVHLGEGGGTWERNIPNEKIVIMIIMCCPPQNFHYPVLEGCPRMPQTVFYVHWMLELLCHPWPKHDSTLHYTSLSLTPRVHLTSTINTLYTHNPYTYTTPEAMHFSHLWILHVCTFKQTDILTYTQMYIHTYIHVHTVYMYIVRKM